MRCLLISLLPFFLAACESESRKAEQERFRLLEKRIDEIAGVVEEFSNQQALNQQATVSLLEEISKQQALNQQATLPFLNDISHDLTAKIETMEKALAAPSEQLQVISVDMGDLGRTLTDRIEKIRESRRNISKEERGRLNMLSRKKSELNTLLLNSQGVLFRGIRKIDDLSGQEKERALKIKAVVDELEAEVGHLVLPGMSTSEGEEIARRYLFDKYEGNPAIILDIGFAGSQSPIVYAPEDTEIFNITPTTLQDIKQLDDEDSLFNVK